MLACCVSIQKLLYSIKCALVVSFLIEDIEKMIYFVIVEKINMSLYEMIKKTTHVRVE